jgi:hypothetical protein
VLIHLSDASKHRTACVDARGPLDMAMAIEGMHKPANDQALEPDHSMLVELREMEYSATSSTVMTGGGSNDDESASSGIKETSRADGRFIPIRTDSARFCSLLAGGQ